MLSLTLGSDALQPDQVALWILTVLNTLAILAVVRQLAALPQFVRRSGPAKGLVVGQWSLRTIENVILTSRQMPHNYTLLFVSGSCAPCRLLFQDLRDVGPPPGLLYPVAISEPQVVAHELKDAGVSYAALLVSDAEDPLMKRLAVPGTPYAISIRGDRVVEAGIASRFSDLQRIAAPRLRADADAAR